MLCIPSNFYLVSWHWELVFVNVLRAFTDSRPIQALFFDGFFKVTREQKVNHQNTRKSLTFKNAFKLSFLNSHSISKVEYFLSQLR